MVDVQVVDRQDGVVRVLRSHISHVCTGARTLWMCVCLWGCGVFEWVCVHVCKKWVFVCVNEFDYITKPIVISTSLFLINSPNSS